MVKSIEIQLMVIGLSQIRYNSNDLIRMESDGIIYQFNFKENYIERNFMSDGGNINLLCLAQPDGDKVIRQIEISGNTIVSKYKSILTHNTTISGIIISNNIFSEKPSIVSSNKKGLLSVFEYSNNTNINYEGNYFLTNNLLGNFKSVEDKVSALDAIIGKFGFGYSNVIIQSKETKTISLIPANIKNRIWYSDVFIYNSTGSFVAEGRIMQKQDNSRIFVCIYKTGSDAEGIVVDNSSGDISITNNTSSNIEVFCSSLLRTY